MKSICLPVNCYRLLLGISHPQLIYELHGDGLLSLSIKYTGFLNHNHLLVNEKALLLKITTDSSASTLVFSRLINSNEILRIQRMEMLLSFIPYGAAELQTVSVFLNDQHDNHYLGVVLNKYIPTFWCVCDKYVSP